MKEKTLRVLVVEDDEDWQDIFQEVIEDKGHTVDVAGKFTDAVARLDTNDYDLTVVDIRLEEDDAANANGLQLLPAIRAKKDYTRIVVATGYSADPDKLGKITQAFKQYNVLDSLDKTKRELLDEELGTILDRVSEAKLVISKGPLFVLARSDIHTELHKLLDDCTQFTGADLGQFLLCEGTDDLIVMVSTIENEEGFQVKANDSVSGKVVLEKTHIIIPDTGKEPLYKCCTEGMLSELAVPLMEEDKVIGVLNVESYRLNAFSENDAGQLMNVFAKQSVMLIENARLNQQIDALRDIETKLLETDIPQQELLRSILKNGLALIDGKFGSIVLRKEDELVVEVSTDEDTEGKPLPMDSVCGEVIRSKEPIRLPDVSKHPAFKKMFRQNMKSELAVPLIIEGEVEGVFNVESPKPAAFTEYDQNLLSALAKEAGIAIRMARSYERLKLAHRREPLAKLGELSGTLVHRINNTLGLIKANSDWAKEELKDQGLWEVIPSEVQQVFDETIEDADKVVDDIKLLRRESTEPIDESVNVNKVIESVVEHWSAPEKVAIVLELDETLPLARGSNRLRDVMHNLLDNALKAMEESGGQTLWIRSNYDSRTIIIEVEDTGTGIPEILLQEYDDGDQELWKPYTTTYKGNHLGSHGFGLWWSRLYIRSCGGELRATNTDRGALFTIVLSPA